MPDMPRTVQGNFFFSFCNPARYELTLFLVFEKEALKVSRQSSEDSEWQGVGEALEFPCFIKATGSPRNHKKKPWTIQFRVPNQK